MIRTITVNRMNVSLILFDERSFLRVVQTELEGLAQGRVGLRGRFKEFLRATSIADQIDRYKTRVNELRSNFLV